MGRFMRFLRPTFAYPLLFALMLIRKITILLSPKESL